MLSTDDILTGLGLVIVLAIGCQLVAARIRLPAIVLLLPAGFIAGAITDEVNPNDLFGSTFQPLVSLGVGLILFEAGLRLRWAELRGGSHRVVVRLITIGALLTLAGVTVAAKLIFGLDWGVCLVLGAILVVSGLMVLLLRPLDVALATWRSRLDMRERAFVTWMAPRGIVAAATASSFGLQLSQAGVGGASQILPIAFTVIFGTVVLYGLTAGPGGRPLRLARARAPTVLVVGG